jgi:hypothetical protein
VATGEIIILQSWNNPTRMSVGKQERKTGSMERIVVLLLSFSSFFAFYFCSDFFMSVGISINSNSNRYCRQTCSVFGQHVADRSSDLWSCGRLHRWEKSVSLGIISSSFYLKSRFWSFLPFHSL